MAPTFKIVIPARYAASRLPGKLLAEIQGKPLLQHVYESAQGSQAEQIIIATDDAQIYRVAQTFGAEVIMTAATHRSGTERIAEIAVRLDWSADLIIVNVQGDELALPSALIDQLAQVCAQHPEQAVATLCEPLADKSIGDDPNIVKVVFDANHAALYFSRANIPWGNGIAYKHIGLYAYRAGFLQIFHSLPTSTLADSESLEQLRILQAGHAIHVAIATQAAGIGIDTKLDLQQARKNAGDQRSR